jgi:hypothetical protein
MELPESYYEEMQGELFQAPRLVKYGGAGAETWYLGWEKVLHYPGESEIWSDPLPTQNFKRSN